MRWSDEDEIMGEERIKSVNMAEMDISVKDSEDLLT
jgi:hypothetical protein